MIPVRLQLKDFLSYAEPDPIDFTTFDVACLSGDNGVGKSALLDAMTWALFGRARGCESGQNQDRLIRDGQTEAVVDLTFALGDATYRIVRRRMRTPRGDSKGDVRFLVADGDTWKNIAGENLKATDEKISSVLRMDYDTFTASAFFLQGRSEDFLARMSATDRKEVFARLLDLGVYEQLEDAARERARVAERSRQSAAARVGELEASSIDVDALERELVDLGSRSDELDRAQTATDEQLAAARDAQAEIEKQQALLEREHQALAATTAAHADAEAQLRTKQHELAELDALLERADDVRTAVGELEDLRAADAAARTRQAEAAELVRRAAEIGAGIDAQARAIAGRIEEHRTRIAALERELGPLTDAATQLSAVDADLASTADPEPGLAEAREQLASHQAAAATFDEQIRAADERIAAAEEAVAILAGGGGECPVCGHELDEQHRAQAKARLTADVRAATADQQAARAAVATARKEAKRMAEEIRRLDAARVARERLTSLRGELLARLERLQPVREALHEVRAALEADELALADELVAADARREQADLEQRAARIYDANTHREVTGRIAELEPAAKLLGTIEEAGRRRDHVLEDIEAATARAAQLEGEREQHVRTIDLLTEQTAAAADVAEHVRTCAERLDGVQRAARELAAEQARVQERLETGRRTAAELEQARAQERALATETRRYRRLIEAFGRGGIPDRVIDNAVPSLTEDANRILGRLSDHEMSVSFQLQRDTRSGKAKETFEALVHHDGGVRDFAMFSGGEAFRVAFAVRLAMSKLLVARAGARLETLVIDEGFGTQDPQGRERLVEAINLARTEFAKILVITHLEDLKDQFGAQIVVSKGADGSLLQVTGA